MQKDKNRACQGSCKCILGSEQTDTLIFLRHLTAICMRKNIEARDPIDAVPCMFTPNSQSVLQGPIRGDKDIHREAMHQSSACAMFW